MLQAQSGNLRSLFNTSGGDYKAPGMKDRLPTMSEEEAIRQLASNGNLIKRPFAIAEDVALVGFDEDTWKKVLR